MYIDGKRKEIDLTSPQYSNEKLGSVFKDDKVNAEIYLHCMQQVTARNDLWKHNLDKAREDLNIYNGNPFTPDMLARYHAENMKTVAVKKIKRGLNIIASNVFRGRQTGVVRQLIKDEKAISANDVQLLIDKLQIDTNFDDVSFQALKSTMITGFFNYVELELQGRINENGKPVLVHYDWDCILPPAMFNNDFRNCNDIIKMSFHTPDDLRAVFPERIKAIDNYCDIMFNKDYVKNIYRVLNGALQRDVSQRIREIPSRHFQTLDRDLWAVFDWIRPMYVKTQGYITQGTNDFIILPVQFSEEDVAEWEENNPNYILTERREKVLWRTVFTSGGVVLYNGRHWYQNDCKLNGSLFACEMIDRQPDGFIRIAEDLVRMQSCAATEGLRQMVLGSGQVALIEQGSLVDPENFDEERLKRDPKFEYIAGRTPPKFQKGDPDTSYLEYDKRLNGEMDETLGITDDIRGRSKASSSNFRTQTAIIQSMTSYDEYIRNFTQFSADMTNVYLSMLPYIYRKEEIVLLTLPFGANIDDLLKSGGDITGDTTKELTINKQEAQITEDDDGKIAVSLVSIANDPMRSKYTYTIVKDSPTQLGRELEAEEAARIISGIGNIMQTDPETAAVLFASYSNRILRICGLSMIKNLNKQQGGAEAGGDPMSAMAGAMGGAQPQLDPNAMAQMQQPMPTIPQQSVVNPQQMQMTAEQNTAGLPNA